jgi:hypothetical protein
LESYEDIEDSDTQYFELTDNSGRVLASWLGQAKGPSLLFERGA